MTYAAKVIADSVAPHGIRLTTLQITFPRFILAELNTHRMFSRNSASSRAIPPERIIERVQNDPFVPETFNRRVKGMGVGDALGAVDQNTARMTWLNARDKAVQAALVLLELDCDKSRINRLLEPFMWHTALVTATEWSNFFALRDHPAAQPEFQIVARMMREAMAASTPRELGVGQWHLPYVPADTYDELLKLKIYHDGATDEWRYWAQVSAGRCFTVSYDRLDEIMGELEQDSMARTQRGASSGHWSPLEHPATVSAVDRMIGNFRGYVQLRKFYPEESDFATVLAAQEPAA